MKCLIFKKSPPPAVFLLVFPYSDMSKLKKSFGNVLYTEEIAKIPTPGIPQPQAPRAQPFLESFGLTCFPSFPQPWIDG